MGKFNQRKFAFGLLLVSFFLLIGIAIWGKLLMETAAIADFSIKNRAPSIAYPFGTDWMGRDMFARTLAGLSISSTLGLLTASVSAVIAFFLATCGATMGRGADACVLWLIDLLMGIPHILLLILISFACGKGFWGVTISISLTHWASLARLMRSEILQLRQSQYILLAQKLGVSKLRIATRHIVPNLLPQFLTGLVLLFPHAILHEASITFLGFGLSGEQSAIGMILSESMKYLAMGKWWLAVFPGLSLVGLVILFHLCGESLRRLTDPASAHT